MPKIRILRTLGFALAFPMWVLAQDPAGVPAPAASPGLAAPEVPEKLTEAEKTVDQAIAKLREIKSASADLVVAADMLNQKFSLTGDYKKAEGNRVFMLLSLQGSSQTPDRMLQVCDGVTLWDFIKLQETTNCTRRSIDKILKVLNTPDCDPKLREDVLSSLGFVGPESVLGGVRKAFVIDQTREGEFGGKPVWILGGTWRDSKVPVMPGGSPAPFGGPLPPYVPTLVYLTIGKADGWPYQVVFEGRLPAQIEQKKKMEDQQVDAAGHAVNKRLTAPASKPSKLTLTYSNVKINVPISEDTFSFEPPKDTKTRDETEQVVSQLERIIAASAEEKKKQAAKAGPVLEGAVPAPAPGGDAVNRPSDQPKS